MTLNLNWCRGLTGTLDALAGCSNLQVLNCSGLSWAPIQIAGEITPQLVAWLSGIKEKNLNGCGKFTLASDMSAIRDITSIDLSNMNTLEGKRSIEVVVETITPSLT